MNSKETPPPKSFKRSSIIDFSCLPKSSMSTPLNTKTQALFNRMKPSQIVALTPKVKDQTSLGCNVIDEIQDEDETLDQSALEDLDVSYRDWKATWSEKGGQTGEASKKKIKLDWSVEDQDIIAKLNETRNKLRRFDTISECSMEEYQEEELQTMYQISKTGYDTSSVQIIDEETLVDDADEADETIIAQGKRMRKLSKEATKHVGSTIVFDDTEDKIENPKNETSIEDGEIIDDTIMEESVVLIDTIREESTKIPKFSSDNPHTKSTVTVPPHLFQFNATPKLTKPKEEQSLVASSSYLREVKQVKSHILKGTKVHHSRLRPIVIDGSNVAFAHGRSEPAMKNGRNGSEFSCWGIKLVVEYFVKRGHDNIVAFVPEFRKKSGKSRDGNLLNKLEEEGHLAFTPSREVAGRFIASHDDRFILGYAAEHGGIVVTRDNFRDHYHVPEWKDTIQNRLLQPTFVRGKLFRFPDDPMGKNGVSLDQFLRF